MEAQPGKEGAFLKRVATPAALDGGKKNRFVVPVEFVTDNRVAKACQVDTNLMGSAGIWEGLKDAVISGAPQKAEGGKGLFAPVLVNDGEMLFVSVWNQGEVASGFAPGRPAVNRGYVTFLDLPALKGKGKGFVSFAVLREDHKPRRFPVYTVNRINPLNIEKFCSQLVQPLFCGIPAVGADRDTGYLVQRNDVFILVNKKKRGIH
jgi:hypothetical protein